jgi:hypothetical protein
VFLQFLVCGRSVMVGWQNASTAARHCYLEGRRRKPSIFEKAVSRTGRSARWTASYTQGSISLIPRGACTGTRNGRLDQSPNTAPDSPTMRATSTDTSPTPQPRSSTFKPDPMPARRKTSGVRSLKKRRLEGKIASEPDALIGW